jgi:hypothetical protein
VKAAAEERARELGVRLDMFRETTDGAVVLCHRDHSHEPWITWRMYAQGSPGFHHGHYFESAGEAFEDYCNRR